MNLLKRVSLVIYFSILLYIVFFAQRRQAIAWNVEMINVVPFRNTINSYYSLNDVGWLNFSSNLFGNILLFIPFPFFIIEFFEIFKKKLIIGIGIFTSFLIEFLQYIFRIGIPDIDDVLFNTSGVIAGVILWKTLFKTKHTK